MTRFEILKNKGFTAIELMVALALVGIIAGIGLVNYFQQIPRYELREAGRDIVGRLRLLRQTAITEGSELEISFDVDDGSYETENFGEQELPSHVRFGVMYGVDKATYPGGSLPPDGISFPVNEASFQADGLPVKPGTIFLTNAPYRNEALAISVNFAGRVKLFRWDGDDWQ